MKCPQKGALEEQRATDVLCCVAQHRVQRSPDEWHTINTPSGLLGAGSHSQGPALRKTVFGDIWKGKSLISRTTKIMEANWTCWRFVFRRWAMGERDGLNSAMTKCWKCMKIVCSDNYRFSAFKKMVVLSPHAELVPGCNGNTSLPSEDEVRQPMLSGHQWKHALFLPLSLSLSVWFHLQSSSGLQLLGLPDALVKRRTASLFVNCGQSFYSVWK